jgi:hypothetical protein
MKREPEPLEQIDYGINHGAHGSSSNSISLKIDGGTIAIAVSIAAIAIVIAGSAFLPLLAESKANEAVAIALRPMSAQVASAQDRAWLAERNSTLAAEQVDLIQVELAKRGIHVSVDGHQ